MKQNLISENKVLEEVTKAIAEGIDINPASVKPESSLIRDLGAESLDFLDINYRLEQTFGIKMARHTILEHMEEMFGEESAIDADGKLTAKAAEVLNLRYNGSGYQITAGMDMDELPGMVTVQSIVDGVMSLLDTMPEKCSECGNQGWKLEDETRIVCGSCNEQAAFINGDDLVDSWLQEVQEEKKVF
ncbi:MAG: phosphopantetheine-binding protein [Syntrophobacteraceae bacterium]